MGSDDSKELVTFQQELTEAASKDGKAERVSTVIFFSHTKEREKDNKKDK